MEAVGVVPLFFTTLKIVDQAVLFFDRLQNTPREIRMLRNLVAEIKQDFDTLNPSTDPETGYIRDVSTALQDEIRDALGRCQEFLARYCDGARTDNIFGRIYWTAAHGRRLNDLRGEVERMSLRVINRLNRLDIRRVLALEEARAEVPASPRPSMPHDSGVIGDVTMPAYENGAGGIAERIGGVDPLAAQIGTQLPLIKSEVPKEEGRAVADFTISPQYVQELEARLQERQANLHERLVRDILDTTAVARDTDFPNLRGSTLYLKGDEIPLDCRELRLETLHVAARDERTLVLQFQCTGGAIGVRHLVPLDAFPYISDIDPPNVSFSAEQAVTLMRRDEDCLIHTRDLRYKFTDVTTRQRFQELVRNRGLVAEFEASEITALAAIPTKGMFGRKKADDYILAAGEPLQVWQQDRHGLPPVITMTFLGGTPKDIRKPSHIKKRRYSHLELHFGDRVGDVQRVKARGSRKLKSVQGQWIIPGQRSDGVRVTFQDEREARRFERLFKKPSAGPRSSTSTSLTTSTYALSVVPSINYMPPETHKELRGEIGMHIDGIGMTPRG